MLDQVESIKMDIRPDITYLKTGEIQCPVCNSEVSQEDIKTGRGRLDAGPLTDDLHRNYIPSEDHGEAFPVLYLVLTCPNCYYSTLKKDFLKATKNSINVASTPIAKLHRKRCVSDLFENIPDFTQQRNLLSGLAAYVLAISTYNQFDAKDSPTIRMAICAMRCAWLTNHIKEHGFEDKAIDQLRTMFYRKALFLYDLAMEYSINGTEDMSQINDCGPDFDKDYGHDGVVYLSSWLALHFGERSSPFERETALKKSRTNLSKVFGLGKSSKVKPSALLNFARKLFDEIEIEISKFI